MAKASNKRLDTEHGLSDLRQEGKPVFRGAFAGIELSDGTRFTTQGCDAQATADGAIVFTQTGDHHRPEIRWVGRHISEGMTEFVLEVHNNTGRPMSIERLDVFVAPKGLFDVPMERLEVAQTGWMSWSYASPPVPLEQHMEHSPPPVIGPMLPPTEADRMVLPWMTQLRAGRQSALIGFTTAFEQAGVIHLQSATQGHRISASTYLEGVVLEDGATVRSERLLVAIGDQTQSLSMYALRVAEQMSATRAKSVTTGWCSWYHFYTRVSEADVLANLQVLQQKREQLPVDVVQLDDGYQTAVGDWLSLNDKFPNGMRFLTNRIHAAGFDAGLWLAPFIASEHSAVYKQHPDWFLHDHNGLPLNALHNWGSFNYALDVTHPEVEAWLEKVFSTIVNEWGYDYLKIDFIYAAAMRGVRYDKTATSIQAYRKALGLVRRIAGERFVLGCGAVFIPSVGLVDGMRIGSDTAEFWWRGDPCGSSPALVNAIRDTLAHGWMHKTLWVNDPDCLIVRKNDSELTLDEVRTWATAIAMSGGMMLLSDDLSKLEADRMHIIPRLLPVASEQAVPATFSGSTIGIPNVMVMPVRRQWEHWLVAAVYNWTERAQTLQLDLRKALNGITVSRRGVHVLDLWSGEVWEGVKGNLQLPETAAHAVRLLAIRPAVGRPQLLGTTFHLLGGVAEVASESWQDNKLSLQLTTTGVRDGELVLYVPHSYKLAGVSSADMRLRQDGNVLRVCMTLRDNAEVSFVFKKGGGR